MKAAQWLETIPAGSGRDAAVSTFANKVVDTDPAGAAAWAATIADNSIRNNSLERIARHWMRVDETAASSWILASPLLTDEVKKRLLGKG